MASKVRGRGRGSGAAGRPAVRAVPLAAALAAAALAAAPATAQVSEASREGGTLVGRVCADVNGDGRCEANEPGLADLRVTTDTGLTAITDAKGRFHLAAVPGRTPALGPGGVPMDRLVHAVVTVDVTPLGPGTRAPAPVWVDLVPGAAHRLSLAVGLPRHANAPAIRTGAGFGGGLRVRAGAKGPVLLVPARVPAGHRVTVGGARLALGPGGRVEIPVPLAGRASAVTLVDQTPDGRRRIALQRVLRVPRRTGGDLLVPEPLAALATVDLPPDGAVLPPGRLRVPISAPPGTEVGLAWPSGPKGAMTGNGLTVPASGHAVLWVPVTGAGPRRLEVTPPGATRIEVPVTFEVRVAAGNTALLAADLHLGLVGGKVYGAGRLTGTGRVHLLGGTLTGVLEAGDDDVTRIEGGGPVWAPRRPGSVARWADPTVAGAAFGDASTTTDANPMGLPLTLRWTGPAGAVALGPARTGLSTGEVGRFDRPVVGPAFDLHGHAGPVRLEAKAAVDASAVPAVAGGMGLVPMHVELAGTGGAVYWLPGAPLAPGSERIYVEVRDRVTGLAVSRRRLERGRDYDLDPVTGRLLLAAPLGLEGAPPTGRLASSGLGWETVLVVDDARLPAPGEATTASGGGEVRVGVPGATLGVRAAGVNAGRYGMVGATLDVAPVPWARLHGSVARSRGWAFAGDDLRRSRDGGLTFFDALGARPPPLPPGVSPVYRPGAGNAFAVRLRLGTPKEIGLVVWGRSVDPGYRDGVLDGAVDAGRSYGGTGRLTLGRFRLDVTGARRQGLAPTPVLTGKVDDATLGVRASVDLGPFTLAAEGQWRYLAVPAMHLGGHDTAAGLEVAWRATRHLTLLAGRLQGLAHSGTGPGGLDPSFTSVGVRLRLPGARRLVARGGIHDDGRPAATFRLTGPTAHGATAYTGFAVTADGPWTGQGVSSVSGARQVVLPGVAVYAESRVDSGDVLGTPAVLPGAGAPMAGDAVGTSVAAGILHLSLSYERARRLEDPAGLVRDAGHARVGLVLPGLSASAFGEVTRARAAMAAGFERQWAAGLVVRGAPAPTVDVDGAFEIERAMPDKGPALRGVADLAWRPAGAVAILLHYGLRQDARPTDGVRHRTHLGRIDVVVGALPGPELTMVARVAVDRVLSAPPLRNMALAAAVTARLGWPLFGRLEPALELGIRGIRGGNNAAAFDPTARAEVTYRMGPVEAGVGAVLAGFGGSGLETATGQPVPPRVYLVLRGVL